jgi:hypothetical protein
LKKLTYVMFALTLVVVFTIVFSPLSNSSSYNPCTCSRHPSYYQYLNILVGDSQIPSNINVNETKTVVVTIQNDVPEYPRYTIISNVYVRLSSDFGHFSGGSPIFIGDLTPGTRTVSWAINGTSDGYDYLQIILSGTNYHNSIDFQDGITPLITVGQPTGPTPSPLPIPTPTPSPPISNPGTGTTSQPSTHSTPQPTPTSTSNETGQTSEQLEIHLLSPTQSVNWLPQTNNTIRWACYGGKAPLNVTLEYSFSGGDDTWQNIATNLPANSSITWITPKSSGDYYVRANVMDSATSAQTASTTVHVLTETDNSGLPILPIAAAVTATIIVLAAITIMKTRKTGKTKQ